MMLNFYVVLYQVHLSFASRCLPLMLH